MLISMIYADLWSFTQINDLTLELLSSLFSAYLRPMFYHVLLLAMLCISISSLLILSQLEGLYDNNIKIYQYETA